MSSSKLGTPRMRDRSAYHFLAKAFLYSCSPFGEVIVVRVSVRLQEQIFNVPFEKLALGRSPMCRGLSGGETTHDEWQRLYAVNEVVLYQAFSYSHEERSRHKSGRISQPHYFNRENCYVFKSNYYEHNINKSSLP
jgi:hypothetical protein